MLYNYYCCFCCYTSTTYATLSNTDNTTTTTTTAKYFSDKAAAKTSYDSVLWPSQWRDHWMRGHKY